jgi:hypothetical protein
LRCEIVGSTLMGTWCLAQNLTRFTDQFADGCDPSEPN